MCFSTKGTEREEETKEKDEGRMKKGEENTEAETRSWKEKRGRREGGRGRGGRGRGGLCSVEAGLDWHLPGFLSSQALLAHVSPLPTKIILPLPTILRACTSNYFLLFNSSCDSHTLVKRLHKTKTIKTPWKHYAQRKKPNTKDHVFAQFFFMEHPE